MDSPPKMLATSRERRSKAGNRLAELLEEEEDDFYKSAYGGFEDDENDSEFKYEAEVDTDSVESDFSDASPSSSGEEDEEEETSKPKSKKSAMPYKMPTPKPASETKKCSNSVASFSKQPSTDKSIERKNMRHSTALKSAETVQRLKELKAKKERKEQSKKMIERYQMTQEKLLEEAKRTEIINLRSLEDFEKSELEKREHAKAARQKTNVPMIRWHSVAMPCIEHAVVDKDTGEITGTKIGQHERTFISFPDKKTMDEYFPKKKAPPPPKPRLTANGEPARYFDPVTKVSYNIVAEYRLR